MFNFAAASKARPGQYARFAATGAFLRIEDRPSNGLGFIFRCQPNRTFERVLGL